MTGTTTPTPRGDDDTALPTPRQDSRWRWSRPRRALVAGGVLAAVVGLGVAGTAGTAGATGTGGAPSARSPGGGARPTVAGKITALSGDDITVETTRDATVTVVYSSRTTFQNGGTATSASALKVGDFVGVQGTESDGTVTASTVMVGRPPGSRPGRSGGSTPRRGAPPGGAPTSPSG